MDDLFIPVSSLLRVLEGATAATTAPHECSQFLAEWFRHYRARGGDDTPEGVHFSEWHTAISSNFAARADGVLELAQITLAVALLRAMAREGLDVDPASFDTIWGLIYDAIVSAQRTEIRFTVSRSAQGFLAVPLCSLVRDGRIEELWRFHTWLPDGQRGVSEEVCIHAHQPFGQSWTLVGSGIDYTFEVDSPDDPSLNTHAAYECCYTGANGKQSGTQYQSHQITSTIRNTGRQVRSTLTGQNPHSRDMTYVIPGGAYHRSIVSGRRLHATLFVFDAYRGYDDTAAVLGPKDGGEYVQLRDPDGITPESLAHMVEATRKWEQAHNVRSEADDEHDTVMGYYRFFRGFELLRAGRREEALQYLNPAKGCTPAQAFAREPSQQHRSFITKLAEVGIDLPDEVGLERLDQVACNGNTETKSNRYGMTVGIPTLSSR